MNHTTLLNHLAAKHNLKYYLEIGVKSTAQNFDKITAPFKHGVDPNVNHLKVAKFTSDEWFHYILNKNSSTPALKTCFDLVLIDGDHSADQVERDFNNSLKCLNDGGYIVIHDCLPTEEITTCIPRGNQKRWHGTVYKFAMTLHTIPGIDFKTYDFDEGCCVVWKDPSKKGIKKKVKTDWESYVKNGRKLMNVTDEALI